MTVRPPAGWRHAPLGDGYNREVGEYRLHIRPGALGWSWSVYRGKDWVAAGRCEPTPTGAARRAVGVMTRNASKEVP